MKRKTIPLADPETWLPLSALWPPGHIPTKEEQEERDQGIDIAYHKALRRRYAARGWAKRVGNPMPSLDEPVTPHAGDFPWNIGTVAPEISKKKAHAILGYQRDVWTPKKALRDQRAQAEDDAARANAQAKRLTAGRLYGVRAYARRHGLPIPPTPTEIRDAELASKSNR